MARVATSKPIRDDPARSRALLHGLLEWRQPVRDQRLQRREIQPRTVDRVEADPTRVQDKRSRGNRSGYQQLAPLSGIATNLPELPHEVPRPRPLLVETDDRQRVGVPEVVSEVEQPNRLRALSYVRGEDEATGLEDGGSNRFLEFGVVSFI